MTFGFFHLPREVRDRIYSNLRSVGSFSLELFEFDDAETIKAAIDVKPSTLHLLVSKRFKSEYVAVVISGATLAFGPTPAIHPRKIPVLAKLILDNVKKCKVDLFIPYKAHKVQKEAQLNTICDPDVFLDLPFEDEERIGKFLNYEDDSDEEGKDAEGLSNSEIEWEDAAKVLDFSDGEDELKDLDEEQNTLIPDWIFRLLFKLRALQSVELVVTSGEPMPTCQAVSPADSLQLMAAEMKDLLRVPFLSKLEARRVVVEDYGFYDTKFAGVQRCGIWTLESGWKSPEEVGMIEGRELELVTNECPGWSCGDPTCLGVGNKHPYPRKWVKTPQELSLFRAKEVGDKGPQAILCTLCRLFCIEIPLNLVNTPPTMADEVYDGAIGIDLGTTYSCVANYEGAGVEIIANEQGSFTTPSFVSFTAEERLIGEAAKNNAAMNPVNTVFDVKRLIGRRFDDPTVKKDIESWPFKVVDDDNNPKVQVEYLGETKTFSPQEISAMVLGKMKEVAETKLGKKVSKAVITVPAYFNDNQRQATKDAGAIAGLNVLRIINEPTAAAIAYGLGSGKSDKERNVLIYDLGGGTFDVSLLHIQGGVFTVKATAGDTHLGGQDFDTNLLEHFKKEFQRKTKKDISNDPRALRRLRTACERAKRTLSNGTQTTVEIDSLFDGEDFNANITRARFEDINSKAFNGTLQPVEQVLKDASIEKSKVDEIVLVGGSTRIPKIQKLLSDFFNGKKLEKSINPDEAVAYGAAVQAGILSGKATSADTADMLLLDVVPLSLGVAMEGNIFAPVVPRGQTVPKPSLPLRTTNRLSNSQSFKANVLIARTTRVWVRLPLMQRSRTSADHDCFSRRVHCKLSPIPPMRAGEAVLEVVFEVDVNGILKVTATEKSSGRSANITISNSVGKLGAAEIEKMVEDAAKFKTSDEAFSKKFESRQQLESYISRVEEIVSDPTMSMKLKRGQKEKIEGALSEAMAQLEVEDASSDDLKKKELALKRVVTKAMSTR
ncbi:hypothetical protein AC578_8013 [Pseudocercospora eumusae]|uniref:non-chaperonin molecular chaperone ATPase n=1 Tax=Pseudocercospora eumusae TaxID=321146 RepID=A0A139HGK8_9PEZI|nr:hypothetical protein AC578_8013 [Pseudocercospora eumusae]